MHFKRWAGRSVLAGAVGAGIVLSGTLPSVTVTSAASPHVAAFRGYTVVEKDVHVPADGSKHATAKCPDGDSVVGGGAYQSVQDTQETLNTSTSGLNGWEGSFWNQSSSTVTGVAVAVCVNRPEAGVLFFVDDFGSTIPANSQQRQTVSCPDNAVALNGGWWLGRDDPTDVGATSSSPVGTQSWEITATAGPQGGWMQDEVECMSAPPRGWVQVEGSAEPNPAGSATTATAKCPAGTHVISGGVSASSTSPLVDVGLSTSTTSLKGWHTAEDNNSSSSDSVSEWANCATT